MTSPAAPATPTLPRYPDGVTTIDWTYDDDNNGASIVTVDDSSELQTELTNILNGTTSLPIIIELNPGQNYAPPGGDSWTAFKTLQSNRPDTNKDWAIVRTAGFNSVRPWLQRVRESDLSSGDMAIISAINSDAAAADGHGLAIGNLFPGGITESTAYRAFIRFMGIHFRNESDVKRQARSADWIAATDWIAFDRCGFTRLHRSVPGPEGLTFRAKHFLVSGCYFDGHFQTRGDGAVGVEARSIRCADRCSNFIIENNVFRGAPISLMTDAYSAEVDGDTTHDFVWRYNYFDLDSRYARSIGIIDPHPYGFFFDPKSANHENETILSIDAANTFTVSTGLSIDNTWVCVLDEGGAAERARRVLSYSSGTGQVVLVSSEGGQTYIDSMTGLTAGVTAASFRPVTTIGLSGTNGCTKHAHKNAWEMKNGYRVHIYGNVTQNVLEPVHSNPDGGQGHRDTPVCNVGSGGRWSMAQDRTIERNVFINCKTESQTRCNIPTKTNSLRPQADQVVRRTRYYDNVWINCSWGYITTVEMGTCGNGDAIPEQSTDWDWQGNIIGYYDGSTAQPTSEAFRIEANGVSSQIPRLDIIRFRNNIFYGRGGSTPNGTALRSGGGWTGGQKEGQAALDLATEQTTGDWEFEGNGLVRAASENWSSVGLITRVNDFTNMFEDPANLDFRIKAGHAFKAAGVGGMDIGQSDPVLATAEWNMAITGNIGAAMAPKRFLRIRA